MNKRKLIREISKKTGVSKRQCRAVYNALEDAVEDSIDTFDDFKSRASNLAYDVVDDVKSFTNRGKKNMSLIALCIASGVAMWLIVAASLYVWRGSER